MKRLGKRNRYLVGVEMTGDYAECIQQVSLFPRGCEQLGADPSVVEALDLLVEKGWSDDAKDCARGALLQLCPERTKHITGNNVMGHDMDEKHIMMSYVSASYSNVPLATS